MNKKITRQEVKEIVSNIILDVLDCNGEISGEQDLVLDLGIDSLDLTHIGTLLEQRFDITIEANELRKPHTVDELADLVSSHLFLVE